MVPALVVALVVALWVAAVTLRAQYLDRQWKRDLEAWHRRQNRTAEPNSENSENP